jgi:flavin reductase (DIM6/NTAB) family NADH-FMN oxidoreductase RutF
MVKKHQELSEILSFDSNTVAQMPDRYRAHLINSLSGLKSVNLVGTISNQHKTNLSIVSSFFHLGANPALIGFIIRPDIARRDTLENLRENNKLTINHVHKEILVEAHHTSARFPPEISEFEACGLEVEFRDQFQAPFVAESRVKMAAEMVREVTIEENGAHLIIAKIMQIYVPKTCLEDDGHLDLNKAGSLCASGLDTYCETVRIGRLEYAKPQKRPNWV